MRKIKEVLRLSSLGLSQRQIAASCAVGQATVSEYGNPASAVAMTPANYAFSRAAARTHRR
jgi:hypothetical protein